MRRGALAALLVTTVVGTAAVPAGAATVTVGSPAALEGTDVAVAPDGTAHVVWGDAFGGSRIVRYCRLPRGAAQCTATAEFPTNGQIFSRPVALVADNGARVIVVWATLVGAIETFTRTSADGGTSFGGQIGVGDGAADEYVLGPGNAISGASAPDSSGTTDAQYWDYPLDGSGNGGNRAYIANPQETRPHAFVETWNTTVSEGGLPLFTYNEWPNGTEIGAARVWAFRWSGNGSTRDPAQWGSAIPVGQGVQSDVAGGPGGATFIYAQNARENGDAGPASIKARKLDSLGDETTVASSELVEARSPEFGSVASTGGTSYAATWIRTRVSSRAIVSDVRVSASPDGRSWGQPVTIACAEGTATRPQVGGAPGGGGWVVYKHDPPNSGGSDDVRVADFGPQPQTAAGCSSAASTPPQLFSGMAVLSRSVSVSRRTGRFKLLLQCNGDQLCVGKSSLRGPVGRRLGTVAKGRFRVGSNRRARATTKMTSAGLRALRARRRLPAIVTLTQTGGPPIRGTVTLKISRR